MRQVLLFYATFEIENIIGAVLLVDVQNWESVELSVEVLTL